jgi:hypothetical protein
MQRVRKMRNSYKILVLKPRHSWGDNIKIDLKEIVHNSVD